MFKLNLKNSEGAIQGHLGPLVFEIACFCQSAGRSIFSDSSCIFDSLPQSRLLMMLRKRPFENIVGKGENAGNQHFLLFPQCFLPFPNQISIFHFHLSCLLQILPFWNQSKILLFGKEYDIVLTITCNEVVGQGESKIRLPILCSQGPCAPTILLNVLCLILQIFLFSEAFQCYTTSDWLNHTV